MGRAPQVRHVHVGVVRVDDGGLRCAAEQLVGVAHHPLVQLVLARHHHRQRRLLVRPPRPDLLPEGGDGAGVPAQHHGVQPADVHPELQRVGGHHAPQSAAEQLGLDLPALLGQVPGPVGAHRVGAARPAPSGGCPPPPVRWTGGTGRTPTSGARRRSGVTPPGRPRRARTTGARPAPPVLDGGRVQGVRFGVGSASGFHSTTVRSPEGAPSAVTASTGRPHSSDASRAGSPMVAEVKTNVGSRRRSGGPGGPGDAGPAPCGCRRCRAARGARPPPPAGAGAGRGPSDRGWGGCPGAASPGW